MLILKLHCCNKPKFIILNTSSHLYFTLWIQGVFEVGKDYCKNGQSFPWHVQFNYSVIFSSNTRFLKKSYKANFVPKNQNNTKKFHITFHFGEDYQNSVLISLLRKNVNKQKKCLSVGFRFWKSLKLIRFFFFIFSIEFLFNFND